MPDKPFQAWPVRGAELDAALQSAAVGRELADVPVVPVDRAFGPVAPVDPAYPDARDGRSVRCDPTGPADPGVRIFRVSLPEGQEPMPMSMELLREILRAVLIQPGMEQILLPWTKTVVQSLRVRASLPVVLPENLHALRGSLVPQKQMDPLRRPALLKAARLQCPQQVPGGVAVHDRDRLSGGVWTGLRVERVKQGVEVNWRIRWAAIRFVLLESCSYVFRCVKLHACSAKATRIIQSISRKL